MVIITGPPEAQFKVTIAVSFPGGEGQGHFYLLSGPCHTFSKGQWLQARSVVSSVHPVELLPSSVRAAACGMGEKKIRVFAFEAVLRFLNFWSDGQSSLDFTRMELGQLAPTDGWAGLRLATRLVTTRGLDRLGTVTE